jgi:hypothetical protein
MGGFNSQQARPESGPARLVCPGWHSKRHVDVRMTNKNGRNYQENTDDLPLAVRTGYPFRCFDEPVRWPGLGGVVSFWGSPPLLALARPAPLASFRPPSLPIMLLDFFLAIESSTF